jgi:dihydrofolate reductase
MAKVQYYCAATLDGYIADEDDGIDWLTGYEGSYAGEEAEAPPMSEGGSYERFYEDVGALVSGSVTYEFVLEHTDRDGEWPYRGKPCWVLSSRDLPTPDAEGADVRIVRGDVTELSDEMLASADDRNLWVVGGGNVASQFADAGLLDEVLVTVVPVVLGAGKPLFERPLAEPMQLAGANTYRTGMVQLRYELKRVG